jgi:outer membrane immunogenic protein
MTRRLRDAFSLRARAGVAAGRTLFYGTGGAVRGNIRNSFTTSNTANSFTGNGNEKGWGYIVGGGGRAPAVQRPVARRPISLPEHRGDDYVVRAGPALRG